MLAPSKASVATPAEPLASSQSPTAALAQYILGEEHIEVDMSVDLITSLFAEVPPPTKSGTPSPDKTAKSASKEGAKQP